MMTLDELKKIRESVKNDMNLRTPDGTRTRVLVGMATCGIASGARPVLRALSDAVMEANLTDRITVTQTGCIGLCQYEPIVEVEEAGKPKITYIHMTPEKAREVFETHLKGGTPVAKYTLVASNLK